MSASVAMRSVCVCHVQNACCTLARSPEWGPGQRPSRPMGGRSALKGLRLRCVETPAGRFCRMGGTPHPVTGAGLITVAGQITSPQMLLP